MRFNGNERQIKNAINGFPNDYHIDYFTVREISRKYLSDAHPDGETVAELSRRLRVVLKNWGAAKRKAPKLRNVREFELALIDPQLHAKLRDVARIQIPRLGVSNKIRLIDKQRPKPDQPKDFAVKVISALNCLAEKFLIENSNVTYPMKALLLLTSHMPAFDGNVKNGLKLGGYTGFSSTQLILLKDITSAVSKKITSLPYILGECWNSYKETLTEGIRKSNYPLLLGEPSRVFDVLLFMQGRKNCPLLLRCPGGPGYWYELY